MLTEKQIEAIILAWDGEPTGAALSGDTIAALIEAARLGLAHAAELAALAAKEAADRSFDPFQDQLLAYAMLGMITEEAIRERDALRARLSAIEAAMDRSAMYEQEQRERGEQ